MDNLFLMGPMGMQAFWVWLTLGILLLGIETFLGTQWLLWAAASAGLVSVVCLTGLPFGFLAQVAVFLVLSVVLILLTKRLIKVPGHGPDINDPHRRLVGRQAEILSGFEPGLGGERTGRVMFDGVEWPAVLEDPAAGKLVARDRVIVERVSEGRLYVRIGEAPAA